MQKRLSIIKYWNLIALNDDDGLLVAKVDFSLS